MLPQTLRGLPLSQTIRFCQTSLAFAFANCALNELVRVQHNQLLRAQHLLTSPRIPTFTKNLHRLANNSNISPHPTSHKRRHRDSTHMLGALGYCRQTTHQTVNRRGAETKEESRNIESLQVLLRDSAVSGARSASAGFVVRIGEPPSSQNGCWRCCPDRS